MKNTHLCALAAGLLVAGTVGVGVGAQKRTNARSFATWREYLGGADSSQYSSLSQIDKSNVSQLEVAWTYSTGDTRTYRFNPIVIDGVMYVLAKNNSIVALDASTGKELWAHPNQGAVGERGINYWESADRADRRLLYINGGFLTAIDAKTGNAVPSFGENGRVDVRVGLHRDVSKVRPLQTSNPGRIFENLIIISLPAGGASYVSSPGDVHAYDVRTGKLVWVFHTVPEKGEFGADTWPEAALASGGGVHNWSELTVDESRGIAYIPLGTARYDFYGGNRHGNNLFGNSVLALDARTGKRLWHFQAVHHDLWDYDFPTAPKLLTVRHDGKNVDILAQPSKQGFLYVFDRVTGKPLWPIEERRVPQSDVPGEQSSPTQPIPTLPPPFARQSFTEKDINPYLPDEERAELIAKFRTYRNEGVFTPPSMQGTIELPGHNGGANWGSSAVNPAKGRMYIVSKELPTLIKIQLPGARGGGPGRAGRGRAGADAPAIGGPEGQAAAAQGRAGAPGEGRAGRGGADGGAAGVINLPNEPPSNAGPDFVAYNAPYDFMLQMSNGLSAIGPPWSQLTAYDLNTGKILWQVPDGEVSGLVAQGIRNTGSHAPRGGPVVTGGGLIFVTTSSDRKLRAYDEDTGKVVWEKDLPAAAEGVPAVYEIGGREYVAVCVAAGNGLFPQRVGKQPEPGAGQYMVFALPKR